MPIIQIKTHARMGKWTQFFEVPSESDPNKAYVVSADNDFKTLGCSCPRWIYHRQKCKHIQRLMRELGLKMTFVTSDQTPTINTPEKLQSTLSRFANIEIN